MPEDKKLDLDYLKVVDCLTMSELANSKLIRWREVYRLSKNIRAIRLSRNIRADDVAVGLHLSRNAYTDMEKGKRCMSVRTALYLSKFYNLPITEIIGEAWQHEFENGPGYFGKQRVFKPWKKRARARRLRSQKRGQACTDDGDEGGI